MINLDIPTKEGDPTTFDLYRGQEGIKKRLALRMNAMQRGEAFKALLFAPAGQGKTSLVRILARELAKRNLADHYLETIAGRFETKADLDLFIRRVPAYSIIFIDEIHGLPGIVRDALYPAIQDGIYSFNNRQGSSRLPEGISWIGATTDLGKVHPAMQRRLMPMALEPLTDEDRMWIALMQPRVVSIEAARFMAKRCWSPWEIKDELYATAGDIAFSEQSWSIQLGHVEKACELLGIDQNGLRPKERLILECLHKSPKVVRGNPVYAVSKAALIVMAGVDEGTFSNAIEPKLMRLGYISVGTGVGRQLTEKALKDYFNDS